MNDIISNVSFVVIALNEEFAIGKCLSSIARMKLSDCEIICIDSGSTDNTLATMKNFKKKFEHIKIFLIKGYANSAIARNVGIANASKKYIYFVDGDVELRGDFVLDACEKLASGVADAVTGELEEYQYSRNYKTNIYIVEARRGFKEQMYIYLSGGCFIAKREIIINTGFFDENFARCQDLEFTLRMTRKYRMIAIPKYMGTHHTIPYYDFDSIKGGLKKEYFYTGMVVKRNLLNFKGLVAFAKTSLGIVGGLGLLFMFGMVFLFIKRYLGYQIILFIFLTDVLYGKLRKKNLVYRFILHYVVPFYFLIGLLKDVNVKKAYSVVEVT